MRRIVMAAGVMVAVAVFAALLLWMPPVREPGDSGNETAAGLLINETLAREIVNERYPGSDFELELDEGCAENQGEPCWRADIEGSGKITIDAGSGSIIMETTSDIHCNHTYTEVTEGGETSYQNMGCDNPLPTCDAGSETCRSCEEKSGCLRKRVARFITGTSEQILTWHGYDAIGTGIEGSFDDLSHKCTVSYGDSDLYVGLLNITECEDMVLSYIDCVGGECVMP